MLLQAGYEPAVLQKGPQVSGDWKQVIQDSESLLTRVITLELLLQGGNWQPDSHSNLQSIYVSIHAQRKPSASILLSRNLQMPHSADN